MLDWLIFAGSIAALALALWLHRRAAFPPDPKGWRAPGLHMTVRKGRIHYRSVRRDR